MLPQSRLFGCHRSPVHTDVSIDNDSGEAGVIESHSPCGMSPLIIIAATAVSQRPGSSSPIAPLLTLAWLCLLPLSEASECSVPSSAYRPPPDAQLPFNCTGYDIIDLTVRGLTSPFDLNKTLQFETCSTITQLYLGCNNFVTLERGAFEGLDKLNTLCLKNNQALHTLIPETFEGLGKLQSLWLGANPVLDTLSPGVFRGLSKLRGLSLGGNLALDTLIPGVFQELGALQTLFLSYNPSLRTLIPGVFQGLGKLETLDLNNNPVLRTLSPGVFEDLIALRKLDLGFNIIDLGFNMVQNEVTPCRVCEPRGR